ncbi:hypothetical protein BgiBS90_038121, partial [Biomphalaria glabrata]
RPLPPARLVGRTSTDKVDNAYPSKCFASGKSSLSDPPARPPRRTHATDKVDNAYPSKCSQAESQVSATLPPARLVGRIQRIRSTTPTHLNARKRKVKSQRPSRPPASSDASTDKVDNAYPSKCSQAESQVS